MTIHTIQPSHRPDIATLIQRVETLMRLWRESGKTTTTSTVSKELKISSRYTYMYIHYMYVCTGHVIDSIVPEATCFTSI